MCTLVNFHFYIFSSTVYISPVKLTLVVVCGRQKMLQLSVNIVCSPVAQNTCRDKFGLHDSLWFKLLKKSVGRKILSDKVPLLVDKMASAFGSETYEDLKKKVMKEKNDGKEVSPDDMYKLAALMARWAATDRLPICLLCRKLDSKPEGLGHIFPYSILKEAGRDKFFDHVRGAEGGVSNFGYYAFCKVCEKVFQQGEVYFNREFFRPFVANVDRKIEKSVISGSFPWLYHCLISIIWRLLCFVPEDTTCIRIQALEYLRNYLLNWEKETGEIDARVKLFLLAPNCQIDEMLKDNEVNRPFFYEMFGGEMLTFSKDSPNDLSVRLSCGPLHVNLAYTGCDSKADFSVKGLEDSLLTTKTNKFTIEDKKTRIFPAEYYEPVVRFGTSILSATSRLPSAGKKADNTSPVLKAAYFHLLPKDVSYDRKRDIFRFREDWFEKKGCHHRGAFSITEVKRKGNNEKIVFVAIRGGLKNGGEYAMGLNVNSDGTVEYMKGVKIPRNVVGVDLSVPPFKDAVEKLLQDFKVVG